jgi:15-cis-phytoene synthase
MTAQEVQQYCTALTKSSGSNFYYSFLFLPRERREAMYALYAFCREVDSVVDEPIPGVDPRERLVFWRTALQALYDDAVDQERASPGGAVMTCLADHIRRFGLPRAYFDDIITGVEMDLSVDRYATFKDLYSYCYLVASVVGLVCLKIFGAAAPESEAYAINLGVAFQLTNILRDVKSDAARGRIYLPIEDLERFQVTEREILGSVYTPAFRKLMEFEYQRAKDYYRMAKAALTKTDRQALLPAEIMSAIYQAILERISACDYQVYNRRITLPPLRRLIIAVQVWLDGRLKDRMSIF